MSTCKTLTTGLLLASLLAGPIAHSAPLVNINSATATELAAAISGVGLKRAEAIVKFRQENGPFTSVDGLTRVPGVGPKTLESSKQNLIAK